jgi:hypothetical protein
MTKQRNKKLYSKLFVVVKRSHKMHNKQQYEALTRKYWFKTITSLQRTHYISPPERDFMSGPAAFALARMLDAAERSG